MSYRVLIRSLRLLYENPFDDKFRLLRTMDKLLNPKAHVAYVVADKDGYFWSGGWKVGFTDDFTKAKIYSNLGHAKSAIRYHGMDQGAHVETFDLSPQYFSHYPDGKKWLMKLEDWYERSKGSISRRKSAQPYKS